MDASFAARLREDHAELWTAIHAHPFVLGIGDGSLPREVFAFYLRQDYVYLDGFSRVLALAAAKAPTGEDQRRFTALLALTVEEEMELHRRTCAAFGVERARLEATEASMITQAYASFLLRTSHEGSFEDLLAALLPCAAGYVEIARELASRGLPSVAHLRDWIETYTAPDMVELVGWLEARFDARCADSSPAQRARWSDLYRTSARFELLFFDMAWRGETWPAIVPGLARP